MNLNSISAGGVRPWNNALSRASIVTVVFVHRGTVAAGSVNDFRPPLHAVTFKREIQSITSDRDHNARFAIYSYRAHGTHGHVTTCFSSDEVEDQSNFDGELTFIHLRYASLY